MIEVCNCKETLKSGKMKCNLTKSGQFGQFRSECPGEDNCILYKLYNAIIFKNAIK